MSRSLTTPKLPRNQSGFTLIEIVVILVIIGILAATVSSRFLGSNTFNATIVRDQIIALARNAQQASLGRSSVSLTLTPNGAGNQLTIDISDSGGSINSVELELDGVSSFSGDIDVTSSCSTSGTAITNAAPYTLNFGSLGDLDPSGFGAFTTVTTAARICLNDNPDDSICVSPSGFAYRGDCDV